MWNKRRGFFLVVRFRKKGGRKFMLPVFLPVLEMTLDAAADLAWLWEKAAGGRSRSGKWSQMGFPPMDVVDAGRESVRQLCCLGKWRLVDVDAGDVEVSVDLV